MNLGDRFMDWKNPRELGVLIGEICMLLPLCGDWAPNNRIALVSASFL